MAQASQPSSREVAARKAFAVGAYREAVELFAALYADDPHPNYLHNIGRCYQNLGEWSKALASFQDYLRKSPDLPADARSSVEGYIAEIEGQLQRDAEASEAQPQASEGKAAEHADEHASQVTNAQVPRQNPAVRSPASSRRVRAFAWSLVAAGGALVAVGTYFGVRSLRAYHDAEDACPSRQDCSSRALDARHDAQTRAWTANVTLLGGLAVGAVGVAWVWRRRVADSARPELSLVPRGTGLQLTGRF